MPETRWGSWLACALLAWGLVTSVSAADDAATALLSKTAQQALEAPGDADSLRTALGSAPVWVVAHELCLYGAFDRAIELVEIASPERTAGLAAQIEAHRKLGPRQEELRTLWRPVAATHGKKDPVAILKILDGTPASPSAISRIRVLNERAFAHRLAGRRKESAALQVEAGKLARAVGWRHRAMLSHRLAGQAWRNAGLWEPSLAAWRRAIEDADACGQPQTAARALNETTPILTRLGRTDALLAASEEVVRRYEALGDLQSTSWNEARVAAVYRKTGQLGTAGSWIERALATAQKADLPHCRANALNERGLVERELGRLADAVTTFEEAYTLYRSRVHDRGMMLASHRQANTLLQLGEHHRALKAFDIALEHAKKAAKKARQDDPYLPAGRHGQAQAHQQLGNPEEALRLYEINLEHYEKRGDVSGMARTLSNLGAILASSDEPAEAIEPLERALALRRKLKHRARIASTLTALGVVYAKAGRVEAGMKLLDEAEALTESVGAARELAMVRTQKSVVLADQERFEEARATAQSALDALQDAVLPYERAEALRNLSRAQRGLGEFSAAIESARAGIREASGYVRGLGTEEGARTRERFRLLYAGGLEAAVRAGDPTRAVYFLESGRAGALLESLQARSTLQDVLLPEALRETLAAARDAEAEAFAVLQVARAQQDRKALRAARKAREVAQLRLQATVARVRSEAQAVADLAYPTADDLQTLQGSLTKGEALLLYGFAIRETVCVVVAPDGARIVSLGSHDDVATLVDELRPEEAPYVEPAAVERLREMLVTSLGLQDIRRVLISPVGTLSRVPFALLLPEREVAYVDSGTAYRRLRAQVKDQESVDPRAVLGIGDPIYPPASRLARLPNTREEVRAVAGVALLGEDATDPALRGALSKRAQWRAIHFACHGLLDVDRPMFTSLALTPTKDDDGMLTALDVFQMRVPAELVVLSACETAGGKVYTTEGVVGLTRAFTHAGAPRVLSSLWKVDDEATRALMIEFYKLWNPASGKGLTPAAALQQAQQYVRSQERWAHPVFWAAWTLWGLPR